MKNNVFIRLDDVVIFSLSEGTHLASGFIDNGLLSFTFYRLENYVLTQFVFFS